MKALRFAFTIGLALAAAAVARADIGFSGGGSGSSAQSVLFSNTASSSTASTDEATLFSYSISSATLGVGDKIEIYAAGHGESAVETRTIAVKFGGVAVSSRTATLGVSATAAAWSVAVYITNLGSASQKSVARVIFSSTIAHEYYSLTADTTGSITVSVTAKNAGSGSVSCDYFVVKHIP